MKVGKKKMQKKTKLFVIALTLGILLVSLPLTVLAAQPANKACLGKDFSGYAEDGTPYGDFGPFVSGLASSTQGVGSEFQAHLAGQVPDEVIPNSCND